MLIAGSKANRALAGAVNRRVGAEASLVAAKAWLIRCAAVGILALMIGAGVGLAFLGYSKSRDASGAAERLADTLTKALERSKLRAEIDPASTVKLDPAAEVGMAPGATVRLAQDPTLPMLPRPTREQLGPSAAPGAKVTVRTEYTVFKDVPWAGGEVVTGYTFAPDATVPRHQYCYYSDNIDKQSFKTVHIAADGRYIAPANPPPGFDPEKAAAQCLWFDGRPTVF